MAQTTLPAITALARAGAVERAWALFEQGGYSISGSSPAALAVRGRLLKDRARMAQGAQRSLLFADAARSYSEAYLLAPAPYLAINAATARLLAGDPAGAIEGASATLELLDAAQSAADTPYYLAATRAEALLLLGDEALAEQALAEAARHDPDGWDDRAVTLAQLRAIAAAQHRELPWLDRYAPPESLHFAGHMGLASHGTSELALTNSLVALLDQLRPGFAWGALAAGADIIVCEHLLARGCQIHAVLPCPPDQFEAQSVAPAGDAWQARYHAVFEQVASVQWAGPAAASVHDQIATAHAGELAIGGAMLNARRLSSRASQLIVCDEQGGGANTRRQAELWHGGAGRQTCLTAIRDSAVEATFPPEQPDPARALAVQVAIGFADAQGNAVIRSDELEATQAPVQAVLSKLDRATVSAAPGAWELTLTDLDQALDVTMQLQATANAADRPLSIGLSLAIATLHQDPASGTIVPYGPGPALARRLRTMAAPGTALASNALAVSMVARGSTAARSELYHPGDDELGGGVHILL